MMTLDRLDRPIRIVVIALVVAVLLSILFGSETRASFGKRQSDAPRRAAGIEIGCPLLPDLWLTRG